MPAIAVHLVDAVELVYALRRILRLPGLRAQRLLPCPGFLARGGEVVHRPSCPYLLNAGCCRMQIFVESDSPTRRASDAGGMPGEGAGKSIPRGTSLYMMPFHQFIGVSSMLAGP